MKQRTPSPSANDIQNVFDDHDPNVGRDNGLDANLFAAGLNVRDKHQHGWRRVIRNFTPSYVVRIPRFGSRIANATSLKIC